MTSTPHLALSHTSISYGKASSLLNRQIEIKYKKKDGLGSLVSTVEEIYQNCQRRLEEYQYCRCVIKGSSVANLFSDEPYNDIDVHAVVDLTIYPHHERVSKGYGIKWALLRGIVDSILKSSQKDVGASDNISVDKLLFEEENFIFSTKSIRPFNVHTLRIGKPMLEFTCVAFVREQEMPLRSFDFNSGALEMHIDRDSKITIYSHLPDIDKTLGQISSRVLDTIEPEKIEKKAVERYLAKILLSGYSDPSHTLYPSLFHQPIHETNVDIKESVEKIINYMKMKGLSDFATITALWLMKADTADLKEVSKYCRDVICKEPSIHTIQGNYIKNLIETRRKPELCWFLLLSADQLSIVDHRGDRSIKLRLSTHPLFEKAGPPKQMFITFPLLYLTHIEDCLDAEPFFVMSSYLNSLSHDAIDHAFREELKSIFAKHLAKKEMFPILAAVFDRFELKTTKAFLKLYMHWSESCIETEKKQISSHLSHRILEAIEEGDVTSKKRAQQILGLIFAAISEKDVYKYDKARNDQIVSKLLYKELKANDLKKDQDLLLKYAKQLCIDFICDMQRGGEGLTDQDKTIMQMVYTLYQRSVLTVKNITDTIHICLQRGRGDTGLKYFEEILKKEQTLDIESLYEVILSFTIQSPEELIRLLKDKELLFLSKRKGQIECFSKPLIQLVCEQKYISYKTFFAIGILCFTEEERNSIFKEIFCFQDVNLLDNIIPHLLLDWSVNLAEVIPIEDMELHQLVIFWNHLKATGVKEENILDAEKILFAMINRQEQDISFEIASKLAKQQHSLFFQRPLRASCFSLFSLHKSLSLIKNVVSSSTTEIDQDGYQTFCHDALHLILSHVSGQDFFVDSVLSEWQFLHKALFIGHIEHPVWSKFWSCSEGKQFNRNIDVWLDSNRWSEELFKPDHLEKIRPFLKCLHVHPTFVFDILSGLLGRAIEKYQVNFLFDVLAQADEDIWKSMRPAVKVSAELSTTLFQIILPSLQNPVHTQEEIERLNIAFNGLALYSWYADSKYRDIIMKHLLNLLVTSKQSAIFFALSGKPDLIFINCLDRALEERKWDEIAALKEVYLEFFSVDGRRSSLVRKQISLVSENKDRFIKRCKLWHMIISETGKNAGHHSQINIADLDATELYVFYLSDIIRSISFELSKDNPYDATEKQQPLSPEKKILLNEFKEECIVQFFDLFDTLIKKKKAEYINIVPYTVKVSSELNPMQRSIFTEKFFSFACEILKSIGKQSEPTRDWTDISVLLNYCIIHLSIFEIDETKKKDEIAICRLLETAVPVIAKLYPNIMLDPTFVHLISFLEGTLSKDMACEHLFSWGESIISRRDSVAYEELSLFASYIFRLDKSISGSVSLGINKDMFKDKLFIKDALFHNTKFLDLFIQLFDIGFSRFHHNIGRVWTKESYSRVDIFALFNVYCIAMQSGIINKKQKTEFYRLQNAMTHMLETPLFSPKSRLSMLITRTMLNFILTSDQHGQITLRSTRKDQLIRCIKIYARCIAVIAADQEDFAEYNFNIAILKSVFYHHKEIIRKTLEKEDFLRLVHNLEVISSPKERYFTPIPSESSDEFPSLEEKMDEPKIQNPQEDEKIEATADSIVKNFLLTDGAEAEATPVSIYDFYLQRVIDETEEKDLVSSFLNT